MCKSVTSSVCSKMLHVLVRHANFVKVKEQCVVLCASLSPGPSSHSQLFLAAGHWRRFMPSSKMAARHPTDSTAL